MKHYCSLLVSEDQVIPRGEYTIVRFPYSSGGGAEQSDAEGMHSPAQPDGGSSAYPDERSGLIWPAHSGVIGHWLAEAQFEPGDYSEIRLQFIRDPLNLSTGANTTGTTHLPKSPGMQCFTLSHMFIANADTPVAFRVFHNASGPVKLTLAEHKLGYYTD